MGLKKNTNRLSGHTLPYEGHIPTTSGPYSDWGNGEGSTRCSCGQKSPKLPSTNARRKWHREHKDAVRQKLVEPQPPDPKKLEEDHARLTALVGPEVAPTLGSVYAQAVPEGDLVLVTAPSDWNIGQCRRLGDVLKHYRPASDFVVVLGGINVETMSEDDRRHLAVILLEGLD